MGETESAEKIDAPSVSCDEIARKASKEIDTDKFRKWVADHRFVIVAGLGNDRVDDPFRDFRRYLTSRGAENVKVVRTNSAQSFEENSEDLRVKLPVTDKPIIIIGHSKGGAAAALLAINHPELFRNGKVKMVIPVQAPILGSPVADVSSETYYKTEFFLNGLETSSANAGYGVLGVSFYSARKALALCRQSELGVDNLQGLISVGRGAAGLIYQDYLQKMSREDKQVVNDHIFYVRTYKANFENENWRLQIGGGLLAQEFGSRSDGAVPLEAQRLPSLGKDLLICQASHHDLQSTYRSQTAEQEFLMRAILYSAYQADTAAGEKDKAKN